MTERPDIVAGHRFDLYGCCTMPTQNGTVCGVRWSWIRDCIDESCIGMTGIAHIDAPPLNLNEITQIRQMRAWESDQCMQAVRGAGSGRPPVDPNPIEVVDSEELAVTW